MACKKWESDGLLFTAGELSEDAAKDFEAHLAECEECALELQAYKEMFGEFSAMDLLEEEPSAECDAKILAAMEAAAGERAEPVVSTGGFFTMLMKRVTVPLAIFAIAVTVGVQISSRGTLSETHQVAKSSDSAAVADSTDSSSDSGRIFIQGGGKGVIPVTLEDE